MSKVHVLYQHNSEDDDLVGVITNKEIAQKFKNYDPLGRGMFITNLDDPELLNRIAKESEKTK